MNFILNDLLKKYLIKSKNNILLKKKNIEYKYKFIKYLFKYTITETFSFLCNNFF